MNPNVEKILTVIEILEEMQKGKNSFRVRGMLVRAIPFLYNIIDVMEEESWTKIYVELEVPSDFAKGQMRQTIEKEIAAGRWTWRQAAKNENKLNQNDDKDPIVDIKVIEEDHKDRVFVFKESTKGES